MATAKRCEACLGTGEVMVPDIREKLEIHLREHGAYGLQLHPAEVAELADALNIPVPVAAPPAHHIGCWGDSCVVGPGYCQCPCHGDAGPV